MFDRRSKHVLIGGPSLAHVCFTPESDRLLRCRKMTLWANSDRLHCEKSASLFAVGHREVGHRPTD